MKHLLRSYIYLITITLLLILAGCTNDTEKSSDSQDSQEKEKPIAIDVAMDIEFSAILEDMGDYDTETHDNYSFYTGKIGGTPVVISRTGVGMVNAATATTLLINHYQPRSIINVGTAGGLNPDLDVYDILIGTTSMNIGKFNTEHLDDGEGIKPKTWKFTETELTKDEEKQKYESFESQPELEQTALDLADQYEHGDVVKGKVGSADVWDREIDRIQWLHQETGMDVEDMEAAANAQVAENYDVPFLPVKIVSNSEVSDDDTEDLETAGQYGGHFVYKLVKTMVENNS